MQVARVALRPRPRLRALLGPGLLALLCLLPVLLYLPFLNAPFERDESVYAIIARGLLNGQIPYRDLFDNKPPLVFGWYALAFAVFGEDDVAPRLVAALLLSLTTLTLFAEARLLFSRRVVFLAAGTAGAMALLASPFFAAGALGDMVYANLSYNGLYIAALTFGDRALNLAAGGAFVFAIAAPLLAAAGVGLVKLLLRRKRA